MKLIILFIIFVSFLSCKKDVNNIELTAFTKEFISMYISDMEFSKDIAEADEIIIISHSDSCSYSLEIFYNNSKAYSYNQDDFVGQTKYDRFKIRLFGNETSFFFKVKERALRSIEVRGGKKSISDIVLFDPLPWHFYLNRDTSFCEMRTYKVLLVNDISDIQKLSKKYFSISDSVSDVIYDESDVEKSPMTDDKLEEIKKMIRSNFNLPSKIINDEIYTYIEILINKEGKASIVRIPKSSGDKEFDVECLRVAKIVCEDKFNPAIFRGKKVSSIISIRFDKKLIDFTQHR